MSQDLKRNEDSYKAVKDELAHHDNSGKGEVPSSPEACYGCFHESDDSISSSPEPVDAQTHKAPSFLHDSCNRDR
jgi:hypothetical protein